MKSRIHRLRGSKIGVARSRLRHLSTRVGTLTYGDPHLDAELASARAELGDGLKVREGLYDARMASLSRLMKDPRVAAVREVG
jgi:hypothetical protein